MRNLRALLLLVAIVGAIALLGQRPGNEATTASQPFAWSVDSGLPPEARATLAAIEVGGPFRYDRDGSVFQNRERRLPDRPQGYYREYTVDTPGSADRGARRIVTGGDPPEVYYYTDDHYRTFRRVEARDGR
jgi:ribonuclease T1